MANVNCDYLICATNQDNHAKMIKQELNMPELIEDNKENASESRNNIINTNMQSSFSTNIKNKSNATVNKIHKPVDLLALNENETKTVSSPNKADIRKSPKTSPCNTTDNLDNIVCKLKGTSLNDFNVKKSPNNNLNVPSGKPSNIVLEWSFQNQAKSQQENADNRIRDLYSYKDIYQQKKEENLRKCIENERKNRQFISRPVPNFKAAHAKLHTQRVHAITVPDSPLVLKHSREMIGRKIHKLEELKRQLQPPKFEHRSPHVLTEKPFVPKKTVTVLEQRPFNLQSDKRRFERKQYDVALERRMEERRTQKEEETKKREEERVKEMRKLTTFKARPNPFK